MKKAIAIVFAVLICSASAVTAGKLKFVRTDVDSVRNNFVTATYVFGVDIYADSVENCSNVALELKFDQTKFVKFSEWSEGDFRMTGDAYVIPIINEATNEGRIIISSGSGKSPDSTAPKNPKIIHLEFVVIPAAVHYDNITFTAISPKATVLQDSVVQVIDLNFDPVVYTIHSYVNVWPGDADNNGVVNHLDFATVSYYLGMGPNDKKLRSFKRQPASTLWNAQSVIAWDSAAATYSDCDGNGEVNMFDNLVVVYNYDSTNAGKTLFNNGNEDNAFTAETARKAKEYLAPSILGNNEMRFPVYAQSIGTYLGAVGNAVVSEGYSIKGIEKAGAFDNSYGYAFLINKRSDNSVDFLVGTSDKSIANTGSGVIAYLLAERNTQSGSSVVTTPVLSNMKAISKSGEIYSLSAFSDISDDNGSNELYTSGDNLIIPNSYDLRRIAIISLDGNSVIEYDNQGSTSVKIDISKLVSGVYIVKLSKNAGKTQVRKIVKG